MSECQKTRKVGIVFASESEKRGIERVMSESRTAQHSIKNFISWSFGEVEIISTVSGIGRKRCANATEQLISNGAQCIICAGFSAALDSDARIGDVVVANHIHLFDDDSASVLQNDLSLLKLIPPGDTFAFRIRWCDFVTTDSIVCSALKKKEIYRLTSAAALDMESYGAAEVCKRRGVRFLAIRSISDTANEDLPRDICTISVMQKRGAQILYTIVHPGIWLDLLRLSRQSSIAADNLGDVLGLILLRLI